MIVVSNTSPVCYLLLISQIDVLPTLFNRIMLPQAVREELLSEGAPTVVQTWIAQPPTWLEIKPVVTESDAELARLHPGEREAIVLAERLGQIDSIGRKGCTTGSNGTRFKRNRVTWYFG